MAKITEQDALDKVVARLNAAPDLIREAREQVGQALADGLSDPANWQLESKSGLMRKTFVFAAAGAPDKIAATVVVEQGRFVETRIDDLVAQAREAEQKRQATQQQATQQQTTQQQTAAQQAPVQQTPAQPAPAQVHGAPTAAAPCSPKLLADALHAINQVGATGDVGALLQLQSALDAVQTPGAGAPVSPPAPSQATDPAPTDPAVCIDARTFVRNVLGGQVSAAAQQRATAALQAAYPAGIRSADVNAALQAANQAAQQPAGQTA